jgi:hypothetical protein
MISIELGHLEGMLGCLLGALLHIPPDMGRLIYLAPRAALGRIAIIEHVLDVTLKGWERNAGRHREELA